jgi:hypothetical protein
MTTFSWTYYPQTRKSFFRIRRDGTGLPWSETMIDDDEVLAAPSVRVLLQERILPMALDALEREELQRLIDRYHPWRP